jgi:hypothetical protein
VSDWTCADCGTPGAKPVEGAFGSFSTFDPRYTTGYCDACTVPFPKTPRKTPRKMSRLVRSDVFDPAAFEAQQEKAKLKGLIQLFAAGRDKVQVTDAQARDLIRLIDKYGSPGFHLPDHVRAQIEGKKK